MFSVFTSPKLINQLQEIFTSFKLFQVTLTKDYSSLENSEISHKFINSLCQTFCLPNTFLIEKCSAKQLRTPILKEKKGTIPILISKMYLILNRDINTKIQMKKRKKKKMKSNKIQLLSSEESGPELQPKQKNSIKTKKKQKQNSYQLLFEIQLGKRNLLELKIGRFGFAIPPQIKDILMQRELKNQISRQIYFEKIYVVNQGKNKIITMQRLECTEKDIIFLIFCLKYFLSLKEPNLQKTKNKKKKKKKKNIGSISDIDNDNGNSIDNNNQNKYQLKIHIKECIVKINEIVNVNLLNIDLNFDLKALELLTISINKINFNDQILKNGENFNQGKNSTNKQLSLIEINQQCENKEAIEIIFLQEKQMVISINNFYYFGNVMHLISLQLFKIQLFDFLKYFTDHLLVGYSYKINFNQKDNVNKENYHKKTPYNNKLRDVENFIPRKKIQFQTPTNYLNHDNNYNKKQFLNTFTWGMLQRGEQIAKFQLQILKFKQPLFLIQQSLNTLQKKKLKKTKKKYLKNKEKQKKFIGNNFEDSGYQKLFERVQFKSGFCLKRGKINKSWKKRWFILTEDRIRYYKHKQPDTEINHTELPLGIIPLSKTKKIVPSKELQNKNKNNKIIILKLPRRIYYIKPLQDAQDWYEKINYNIIFFQKLCFQTENVKKFKGFKSQSQEKLQLLDEKYIKKIYSDIEKHLIEMKNSHKKLIKILDIIHKNEN
ncbi:tandem ph domain containing protein [Anaeramoeba flamelloides]|uniref:Tandem ph domain containing protein n=1 Tax=Anaeramoeba flamelloides TaxID=1746091 RepID=A0AAV8A0G3_9EUKA|nr:tandem ph domain containing protein [Anaeramoeba flamelloides]